MFKMLKRVTKIISFLVQYSFTLHILIRLKVLYCVMQVGRELRYNVLVSYMIKFPPLLFRYELQETSQQFMEQLPVLSMVPVAMMDDGSYTARGPMSSCITTARSSSLQHPAPLQEESDDLEHQKEPLDTPQTPADVAVTWPSSSRDASRVSDPQQTTRFSVEALKRIGESSLDIPFGNEMLSSSRSEALTTSRSRYYECPVYEGGPDCSPRSPVLTVSIPAGAKGANYWVQRRVAMYLNQH